MTSHEPTSVDQSLLTIVIPALNEAKRIGGSLDSLAEYLVTSKRADTEVLLVIAKSRDDTLEIARAKLSKFRHASIVESGPGKGYQVRKGMLQAKGQIRLFMDADLATPLHHIETAVKLLDDGADVAIGVRNLAIIHTGFRKYISEISNVVARVVLLLPYRDTQCGFKAFRAPAAEALFSRQRIKKWVFDMEILAVARKHKYRIATFPVADWIDVPTATFQKVGLRDTFSTVRDILKIRLALWSGRYS